MAIRIKSKKVEAKKSKIKISAPEPKKKKKLKVEDPTGTFPFVPCKTPNGQPIPTINMSGMASMTHEKYFGYAFHPNPDLPEDAHLRSLAAALKETRFANIGHVWLTLSTKLVGMSHRGIRQWSVAYDDVNCTITLWVNQSGHMHAIGQFCTEGDYMVWREIGGEWEATKFEAPQRTTKYPSVGDFSPQDGRLRVDGKSPYPAMTPQQQSKEIVDTIGKLQLNPGPTHGIPVERSGKKSKIFGHVTTKVLRWMGQDAWTVDDAMKALRLLGLTDLSEATVKAQLSDGRNGGKNFGPPAPLTEEQGDALNKLIEDKKPKHTPPPKQGETQWPMKGSLKSNVVTSGEDRRDKLANVPYKSKKSKKKLKITKSKKILIKKGKK